MPVYLKEYNIPQQQQQQQQTQPISTVSHSEQTISSNSIFSLTSSASANVVKQSILNTESTTAKQPQPQQYNGNILNNNTNKITNMINNSLVDMKNSLNIQEGNNSLKRKSPVNEEEQQKKKFASHLNGYKSAQHKENGGGDSEGNGQEEEENEEDELELIDSDEMDQDDFDDDDDDEDVDDEEYDEEDEDLPEEIDLEDEEESIKEAINQKNSVR